MTGGQWQMLDMRGPALPRLKTQAYGRERNEAVLAPRRIVGREGIGQLFEYRVEAVARASIWPGFFDEDERTKIDLDRIAGSPIWLTIDLERQESVLVSRGRRSFTTSSNGAGIRHINGVVASARVLGDDGLGIVYEFVVRPSFSLAALKQDSRFFTGSIVQILEDVIRPYGQIEWRIGSSRYPQRDYIRQAWETDWHFFMRLCEEWGFIVWFEHHKREHVLIIADNAHAYRKHERAYETLRYHVGGGHIDEEHISELTLASTFTPGVVTVQDHSYIHPHLNRYSEPFREEYRNPRNTANADQEIFTRADFALPKSRRDAPYDESNWRETAREFARIKLEAIRAEGLRAQAKGALRGIEAGKTLTVTHHPHQAVNGDYLVIGCEMEVCATATTSSSTCEYAVTASFEMRPLREPYRMPQITPRPVIGGFEYAVIVGPENAEMFVDEYNRALVQFDWDRKGRYDGKSAIWVRLATQWHGNRMGTVTHARCGQQVLVGYVHGDPDRPVIASFAVDENNRPPWEMPANRALSGMVSKSLGFGSQTNHLALDDTQSQMQAQLASDHGKSSLSIGYITRIDGNAGRQDARGEGFELRTDQHGGIRAALGLLLTTWGRKLASGKVKEMGETIGQLTAARDLHESCAAQAQFHGAQQEHAEQSEVADAIRQANAKLKGASASAKADFPEFEQADIALSSAANLHTVSAANTHISSECHTALTAAGHVSIAAGKSFFASVNERMAFYAQKALMMITPGPVHIQSHNGSLTQSSQDDLSISSTNGIVRIAGKNGVDILCGGTLLRLRPEGLTGYTSGNFLVHAANHATDAPQAMPVDNPVTPDKPGRFAAHHVLVEDGGGFAVANQPFRQILGGQVSTGVTNELGEFPLATSNVTAFGVIELLSQSAPGDVIGVVQTAVFEDAGATAVSPLNPPVMPKRQAKIGGKSLTTPDTESTSQGKKPTYISCDPLNFGLRSYRFLNGTKQEDVSLASDRRMNIEYPVAKAYTESIKANLKAIDWVQLAGKSIDDMAELVVPAIQEPIYVALTSGAFGFPIKGSEGLPLPKIEFVGPDKFDRYGMRAAYSACFNTNLWVIVVNQSEVSRIARSTLSGGKRGPMGNLANAIYHEARHCQQKFWMISQWATYREDYSMFKNMDAYYADSVKAQVCSIAKNTIFPDDNIARIGMNRMLVFDYYWAMMNVPESAVEFRRDLKIAEQQVCELLNISPEIARKRADMSIGYKSQLHEEDAYTCGDVVDRYWNHEDYFPNPGACRSEYNDTIRSIGESRRG